MDVISIVVLIYSIMAIVVAIATATIIRSKLACLDRFDIDEVLCSMFVGVMWPIAIVGCVVYLVSDFLYCKFFK